jgi:hypothetical protein
MPAWDKETDVSRLVRGMENTRAEVRCHDLNMVNAWQRRSFSPALNSAITRQSTGLPPYRDSVQVAAFHRRPLLFHVPPVGIYCRSGA